MEMTKTRLISSATFAIVGIFIILSTSTGITGNIIRNNAIKADSGLLGFSLGILLLAISALIITKKKD